MSLIYMHKFENSIKVLSDGAGWDEAGNVAFLGSKVRTASNGQPLVVSCTGNGNAATVFYDMFNLFTVENDVETSIGFLEMQIKGAVIIADQLAGECERPLVVYMAGYTKERGFFILQGISKSADEKSFPSCKWQERDAGVNICSLDETILKLKITPWNVDESDFDAFAVPFAQWQRDKVVRRDDTGVDHVMVGGPLQVTTITRDSAVVETVHDFGDAIGEPIAVAE